MLKGKQWGHTQTVWRDPKNLVHIELATIRPGGVCSWHFHRTKWNGFMVLSGKLLIDEDMSTHYGDVGGAYDATDTTELRPGDFIAVRPGCTHRFRVDPEGETVVVAEIYWPAGLEVNDIARMDVGGVLEGAT